MPEVQLTYGKDEKGCLRHILEVENGLSCRCTCPGCGAALVAKNQGANVLPHFAHASGQACLGAHESELHLLTKEVLAEEKALMLPEYGKIYSGGLQNFAKMEVEERNDYSMLQPDVVGIQNNPKTGKTSRLWIEIKVTHEVGPEKYAKIKELGIACVEIDLSMYQDLETSKDTIREFLLESKERRHWINNPVLEEKNRQQAEQRKSYAERMRSMGATMVEQVDFTKCQTCKKHSVRENILNEMTLQKLPADYRKIVLKYPIQWFENSIISPLPLRTSDSILTIGRDNIYLPTQSPDVYGRPVNPSKIKQNNRVIAFFQQTLPQMLQATGTKCEYKKRYYREDGMMAEKCSREDDSLL